MGLLLLSIGCATGFWYALRGGWGGLTLQWPERRFWVFSALATLAIVYFAGPLLGPALIVTFYVQELGHVVALRSLGYETSYRALPVFADPPRWNLNRMPQGDEAFVALMGPVITVPSILIAFGMVNVLVLTHPMASNYFAAYAAMASLYGLFTLLPFWPLPGGRVMRAIGEAWWPLLPYLFGGFLLAALISLAAGYQSLILGFIAFIGIRGLMALEAAGPHQPKMPRNAIAPIAGAYGAAIFALGRIVWPTLSSAF